MKALSSVVHDKNTVEVFTTYVCPCHNPSTVFNICALLMRAFSMQCFLTTINHHGQVHFEMNMFDASLSVDTAASCDIT